MLKIFEYSHLGGSEILQVRYPDINKEIDAVIAAIGSPAKTKVSKEKTSVGKMLYSPKLLNKLFREQFAKFKFEEMVDRFDVEIPGHPYKITGNYKQIDFAKNGVLCE